MVILRANARSLLFLWLINLNDNNHRAKGVVNAVQGTGSCQGLGSWFKHRGVSSSTGESVRAPGSQFEHRGVSSSTGESVRAPGSQFKHSLYLVSSWSPARNSNCKTQGSITVQATLSRTPPTDTRGGQYACSFSVQTRLSFMSTGVAPSSLRFRSFPSRL